jgi:hypothetical protein
MATRQSAALDRKKLLADPIMVTTIVVLVTFLTLFILYPLAVLLVDSVYGKETGLTMEFSTDCPGVQVYTANFLDVVGKNGVPYPKRSGVCLETQYAPDSVNHPEWPQPFVKAGEAYRSETVFRF